MSTPAPQQPPTDDPLVRLLAERLFARWLAQQPAGDTRKVDNGGAGGV